MAEDTIKTATKSGDTITVAQSSIHAKQALVQGSSKSSSMRRKRDSAEIQLIYARETTMAKVYIGLGSLHARLLGYK